MTKRIFQSICLAAIGVFLASAVLFMGVLYTYFSGIQREQLRMQTELASQGVSSEGIAYFDGLNIQNYRITWIDSDGTVLYDSETDSSEMENHLEREEIKEALSAGIGESTRYSSTSMERSFYCAKRLDDGTLLRLSIAQSTLFTLLLGMTQPIAVIFLLAVVLSLILAYRLSKKIVAPLNGLNLEEPAKNDGYDELAPLFHRIETQQRQIRRQSEELRQKQDEFETVTKGMAEGILLLNNRLDILSLNPAAMRIFHADHTCIGTTLLSINRSLELQSLLKKAGSGEYSEIVLELDKGNYQVNANPVLSGGEISGIVLLILDVTQKEKSEQMRREFTANVSHELKSPLHTISGCAELMKEGMVKEEDIPVFSDRIYEEAQRMILLIEDIIRLSHLDEGADDMQRETVDLYALAEEAIRNVTAQAQARNITMKLEGGTAVLNGIPQLLSGILHNLCDNAVKYNREGGSVTVSVEKQESSVLLTVSDTGIGIPPEHQERIFERFYRVNKQRSKEIGGTGLGLSIVKHAARLHDASIALSSEPGKGTAITLRFPV